MTNLDPGLLPDPVVAPAQRAREQFVHALLQTQHESPTAREARLSRLSATLRDDELRSRPIWVHRRWRALSGMAAAAALVALVILGLPSQQSAIAVVQASIQAQQSAGERRYEVRVVAQAPRPDSTNPAADPDANPVERGIATVDARDSDHLFIEARSPWGDRIALGRNPKGAWAIKPDGTIDDYPPARAWPRWADFGTSTILLSTVEDMLETLAKSYTLTRGKVEALDGIACDRISARRNPEPSPQPESIELWIDRQSRVIRRMELVWPPMVRPPHHQFDGPGERPIGPGNRPGGPPDRLDGDRRQHPEGFRPELPDGFRPDPRRQGPDGPGGPPRGGRRPGRGGPRPEFLGGPPDFAGGRHPPPPRKMVFVLVPSAPFPDNWFDASTHVERTPAETPAVEPQP
ncbi:MAG: hypothetical protein ACKVW3_08225 [Phycisphaerales bacterium]